MFTLNLTHVLNESAEATWNRMMSPAFLLRCSSPLLTLSPCSTLPTQWKLGEPYIFRPKIFGVIPSGTHTIVFETIDPIKHHFITHELGGAVKSWVHQFNISALDGKSCRVTDEIQIAAKYWSTPVRLFAKMLYEYRYWNWRRSIR